MHHRRAATPAEAARRAGLFVLITREVARARGEPEPLAPAPHISGIDGAVRDPRRPAMVVPGPARRSIDLEAHAPAQALAGDRSLRLNHRMPARTHSRAAATSCRRTGESA